MQAILFGVARHTPTATERESGSGNDTRQATCGERGRRATGDTRLSKWVDVLKKAPTSPVTLEEAVAFIKANPIAKFDETVDISMHLGVDIKKSDQTVRGTVVLPHGTGKHVRVVVFAAGTHADEAKAAGADEVGYEDLIEKIKAFGCPPCGV